jgi:hypothetical protein
MTCYVWTSPDLKSGKGLDTETVLDEPYWGYHSVDWNAGSYYLEHTYLVMNYDTTEGDGA